ncbi:hypothetical protein [Acetobacter syzygii]|uniref:Uncharacterized protein n=1 Tax=Acetobacter syzygii TaxID=146476 RepID=A0A270B4U9_9PROT|nr:hypothetical protein [Acetobacter syzygii]PAL20029.1 hypothetical protein B9K05_13325 [Acetobacter syzygii]
MALDIDGLVRHPYASSSGQYGKGIDLEMMGDGTMFLTELVVDHFGARPAGFGITRGWYFQVDQAFHWHRVDHPNQYDCGTEAHHTHHLVVAEHFEHALKERKFTQVRERVFAISDVNVTSDPSALKWME